MSAAISKNHHFLPQCYLKGFTHNNKQLFIYDKLKDEIRLGNIEKSFTSKSRNTVTLPDGERSDWLEKFYAGIESDTAYLFPKIINSTKDREAYTPMDKLMLSMFISTLLWRVPSMDLQVQELVKTDGLKNRNFFIKYPEGWPESDRTRFESLLINEPGFQKSYPIMLMFEPFHGKSYADFLDDWKFYYHDPGRHFVSDVPAIQRRTNDPKTILNEFILPLAPNRILIASKGKPQRIEGKWILNINLQLIHQAERYVGSNDEALLRALVNLYKSENNSLRSDYLLEEIFKAVV